MTISNEAVEAAAKVFYQDGWEGPPFWESLDADDPSRLEYLATARLALEAAAPGIRAETLDEVADHLDQPRILWWGDEGAKVADSPDNPRKFTKLTTWLRARAVAERGGQ